MLVNLCATYNFVLKAVADSISMHRVKAGKKKRAIAKLPTIATINSELLRTMALIHNMLRMRDSTGIKHYHTIYLVTAAIADYNVILGMAWLQKQNTDNC